MLVWIKMPYKKLTNFLIFKYCGRKQPGRISLIIDINKQEIYLIPKEREHIDFIRELLGKEITQENAAQFISSNIDLEKNNLHYRIKRILTSYSGLEKRFGIKHNKEDIDLAHILVNNFIRNSEFEINENTINSISYGYCDF